MDRRERKREREGGVGRDGEGGMERRKGEGGEGIVREGRRGREWD